MVVHFLRQAGLTIRAIAAAAGVDKNTVMNDLRKGRLSEIQTARAAINDANRDLLTIIGDISSQQERPKVKRRPEDKRYFELEKIARRAVRLYLSAQKWQDRWSYTTDPVERELIASLK